MGFSESNHLEGSSANNFSHGLLECISRLPKRVGEKMVFVDFDDTLFDADSRYTLDPELKYYGGLRAYPRIIGKFGTFSEYFRKLNPDDHIFNNTEEFYNPNSPNHIILTAGNIDFQNQKIKATRFSNAKRILIREPERKPEVMLHYLLGLGYIPGEIHFYDDRIDNFKGIDSIMSQHLGIPVTFHKIIPDRGRKSVTRQVITNEAIHKTITAN